MKLYDITEVEYTNEGVDEIIEHIAGDFPVPIASFSDDGTFSVSVRI